MRMITRTFRMNPDYDKILDEEAKKHSLSVSALLNQIIRQYVLFSRFNEKTPVISLSFNTFDPLLEHISEKDLGDVAEKTGSILPEEALLQRGQRLTSDNLIGFLETIQGTFGNWFSSTHNFVGDHERIHLSHQLNSKWSIYLRGYISSMFKSVLNIDPKIETRANSITVYLPKRLTTNQILKNPSK